MAVAQIFHAFPAQSSLAASVIARKALGPATIESSDMLRY
jgi:hypothetical protein